MGVRLLYSLSLLVAVTLAAKDPVYPPQDRFNAGPAIVELARKQGVPLTGIERDVERVRPEAGDRCVALISMSDDGRVDQWLLDFKVSDLSEEERKEVAESTAKPFALHTSTGGFYEFANDPVAVDVWVAGPLRFDEKRVERALAKVQEKRARFVVNRELLTLGLDRAAESILRLRDQSGRIGLGMRGEPFPEEETVVNKQRLLERGVTEADERALAGAMPALMAFFQITAQTPGLKEILMDVVDVPWWALVKGFGNISVNMNFDGNRLRPATDPAGEYVVPFGVTINEAPALMVEVQARAPIAPASALAGVTAVYAGRPDGKGARVSIALLAATTVAEVE